MHASRYLHRQGARLIGVMEKDVSLSSSRGMHPKELEEYKLEHGTLKGFPMADETTDDLFAANCDILIPAAGEKQITKKNAGQIKAKVRYIDWLFNKIVFHAMLPDYCGGSKWSNNS